MGEHNFLMNRLLAFENRDQYTEWFREQDFHPSLIGEPLSFPCFVISLPVEYETGQGEEPFFLYPGDLDGIFEQP